MLSVHLFRQWLSQMGIFIESVIYLLILKNWQPDGFQTEYALICQKIQ